MVWQVILCGLLAVSESGDWSSFLKAEQLFYEVYGKKIEAAKTPEAKAALARELLELAKKETDQLAKRVELEQAKRLAVEAGNRFLAIAVIKEIVAIVPCPDDVNDPCATAEELWDQSSQSHALSDKLEAIQMWFYAPSQSALITSKWEKRISDFLIEPLVLRPPYPVSVSRVLNRLTGVPVMLLNATSGFSLNVSTESKDINAMVMQFPLQKDKILPSSRWTIARIGADTFAFQNCNSGLFLTWKEGVWHLVQDTWRNMDNQQWHILPTKNGAFLIRNTANGLFLAPPSDKITEGVGVLTCQPNQDAGIFWRIVVAPAIR
ncbi:MAG: RICIN domain-containing protein [Candidatus Methanomethylicaceae archaeon]